ncbi:hypothetical protein [Streptomyces malaysiense]|uniref:PE-PGRS family protein n=1 Tax=Streptomyces malaysiense TaxID=1428626 RepID=A0A1J4Q5W0_9ACTN|nr:hypothetical protein [Streptomyces malaysiense]OIK28377.1 hypothetical protein VT52_006915 [Streptomyces malaysiense]
MNVPGWCRAVRAGVFAAACVVLAALGHATMSGTPVPWWAVVAGAVGTGAAGWLMAGRERGRTSIVAVVTAAQMVLHETFSLAQSWASGPGPTPHAGPSPGMSAMRMGSTHMGSMGSMGAMHAGSMGGTDMGSADHPVHGMAGFGHMHDMTGMSSTASAGMFAAHFLAAVLCGLWLAYGERAVFRVLRATATWLAAPLRLLGALPTPYRRPSVHRRRAVDAPAPVRLLLCCSLTFRGPPVGAAVR